MEILLECEMNGIKKLDATFTKANFHISLRKEEREPIEVRHLLFYTPSAVRQSAVRQSAVQVSYVLWTDRS